MRAQKAKYKPAHRILIVMIIFCSIPLFVFCQASSCRSLAMHIDKNIYTAGSQVWFKAYAFSKFSPDETSSVLSVDLLDENNLLVSSHSFPVLEGVASGNIEVGEGLGEGAYLIKAGIRSSIGYFDSSAVSYTSLYLFNPAKPRKEPFNNIVDTIDNTFRIYPNSGKLVSDLLNEIFFCATDELGLPVSVTGKLITAGGDSLLSFSSEWNGTGHFFFIPNSTEKYTLVVYRKGEMKSRMYSLEPVVKDRVTISISQSETSVVFEVRPAKELQTGMKAVIFGKIGQNIIFKKDILLNTEKYVATISVKELPPGVVDLIVVDGSNKKLLGYRSFFVNLDQGMVETKLHADSISFEPGGRNQITLSIPDNMIANVSISIIDHERNISLPNHDIVSALLLQTAKGAQATPGQLFSFSKKEQYKIPLAIGAIKTDEQALMNSLALTESVCSETDSGFISISGKVYSKKSGKIIEKGELKILFSGKDSGVTVLLAPIEKNGSFHLKGLSYEGAGIFKYSLNGSTSEIFVTLDSVLQEHDHYSVPINWAKQVYHSLAANTNVYNEIAKKLFVRQDKQDTTTTLEEVKVYSKTARPLDKVNRKYTRGLFSTTDYAKTLDFINDPPPPNGSNIIDYLVGRVTGLYINPFSKQLTPLRWSTFSQNSGPLPAVRLFLNEQETTSDFMTMVRTADVALVKYFPPGSARFPGIGMSGALAVYTRKNEDYPDPSGIRVNSFSVTGFDETRIFSTDEEKASSATTLYWNPLVLFDKTHPSFTIRFTNSFNCRRFEVRIQGFSRDGKLLSVNNIIE